MSYYFLKFRKNTEKVNRRVLRTSNDKVMLPSKCTICGSKKSTFIKTQEASGIVSNLKHR